MNPYHRISVLIVDDHPIVREGLRSLLLSSKTIGVADVCSTGDAALKALRRHPADVVLVDLRMRPMSGVELLERMRTLASPARGLVLSSFELEEEVYQAVTAGAAGFVSKDAVPAAILEAIAIVHAGGRIFPPHLLERLEQRRQKKSLTPRELQVIDLVAKGLTNKEIGDVLGVSQFTVRNQLRSLSAKLEASDRTEVARVAIERGIIVV